MPIVISDHAKTQLKKRKISQKLILDVARNPSEILNSYKNRRLRRKDIGDKIIQAVTITEGSRITIVSGYYLRRRKKHEN